MIKGGKSITTERILQFKALHDLKYIFEQFSKATSFIRFSQRVKTFCSY